MDLEWVKEIIINLIRMVIQQFVHFLASIYLPINWDFAKITNKVQDSKLPKLIGIKE